MVFGSHTQSRLRLFLSEAEPCGTRMLHRKNYFTLQKIINQ
jgi:hypothetical protein